MKKEFKLILIFVSAILVLSVFVAYQMKDKFKKEIEISSYEECIKAGYESTASYPAVCYGPEGMRFIQEVGHSKVNPGSIVNFEQCASAGYPVMQSYPRRCAVPGGVIFTEKIGEGQTCEDLCGDGQCQETVCLATGCPCAETKENCPLDCR